MQEPGVLTAILSDTALRVAVEAPMMPEWRAAAERADPAPSFAHALRGTDVRIIAEAKRRSPSSGAIREDTPVVMLAEAYAWGGAAAISVLTEPHRFGGSLDDLFEVSTKVDLPTLCKDFIIDPVQLYGARSAGAAAVLLIVRALTAPQLGNLASLAHGMGLETLVEVHSAAELEIALRCGPTAIGVNARDLETLAMDPSLHETLLPRIPSGVVAVAESGLRTREDVARVAGFGADAVLIGTAVAKAERPGDAVRALVGVQKRPRQQMR